MEARLFTTAFVAAALVSMGASHRTANFIVRAHSAEIAKEVAQAAEKYRRELAIEWLGKEMPNWYHPCPITVEVGPQLGAGGATSFVFDHGDVFGWQMNIQGSRERILDSVLPHEITHTVFASYFRRPLPRWADEGASSTVEHDSERSKQQRLLIQFLQTHRGIAFNDMFAMKQYPKDILPLYAQGHSLATFLVAQGGKRKFLKYVQAGLETNNWRTATRSHYRFDSLGELQNAWLAWVRRGSPLPLPNGQEAFEGQVVLQEARPPRPAGNLVHHEAALSSEDDLAEVAPGPSVAGIDRPRPGKPEPQVALDWNHPRQAAPSSSPSRSIYAVRRQTDAGK